MFTPYWIDFRSCSEIGRIKCEQCLGKSNGPDRSGVELFTPYQIRYAPCLFWFGKKTLPRVQENDNEIPFQKLSRSAEQPVHMHKERSVPKNYLIRKYHFRNQSVPGHNCNNSRSGPVKSSAHRRFIRYGFQGAPIIDPV